MLAMMRRGTILTNVLGAMDSLNFMQIFHFSDQGWGSNEAHRTDGPADNFHQPLRLSDSKVFICDCVMP
jgi:hypothetical protein